MKEAHLCAIWAPALIAGFETFVHMISLRGRCVSGQGCVLWSVVPARCHPHGQSTNERLQLSTPGFFYLPNLIWLNLLHQCAQSRFILFFGRSNQCFAVLAVQP